MLLALRLALWPSHCDNVIIRTSWIISHSDLPFINYRFFAFPLICMQTSALEITNSYSSQQVLS